MEARRERAEAGPMRTDLARTAVMAGRRPGLAAAVEKGPMTHRVQRRGFTLLELLVVVMIVLVITGTGAIALTSKVPYMKLWAQTSRVMDVIRVARERSLAEGRTYKIRIHQTAKATTVEGLFNREPGALTGLHQFVFSAPVQCWYRRGSSPAEISPTTVFPQVLKDERNYDGGQDADKLWTPILMVTDFGLSPPGLEFPTSLAAGKLADAFELDADVAIIRINEHWTWTSQATPPRYDQTPWTEPLPSNPNPLSGPNPQPAYYAYDDRIADITLSPDQVVKFQPTPDLSGELNDMTITFATLQGAQGSANASDVVTLTIDRRTGFPHF